MSSSILGVGQSALSAAQTGLVTTGHNIANVNTPGYHRQVVVQSAAPGQNIGVGFIGKGTEVSTIQRVYSEFLQNQVLTSQTAKAAADSYYAQVKQIDNILADATSGVSTAMQEFFDGVQDVASNPSAPGARQAMLSSAEAMAARFQSVSGRIDELRQGVNTQITTSISAINSYAQQIVDLNDAIEKAQGTAGETKAANDLLDQRDQVISELSKEVKVVVVKQGNSYNVFMGSGQALNVGTQVYKLKAVASPTDSSKIQVAYESNGVTSVLADSSMSGGRLGGLLDFRTNSLDTAQNSLGRVATGLAMTFNAQHRLGQDQLGDLGDDFFIAGTPEVSAASTNTAPTAVMTATITDPSKLTTSDYRVQRVAAGNYSVTRLADSTTTSYATFAAAAGAIEGVTLAETSPLNVGDEFIVKPTANGASNFDIKTTNIAKIAAAAPIRTAVGATNTGTGAITAGTVSSTPATLRNPVNIAFTTPTSYTVTDTVTTVSSTVVYNPAAGADISVNGWTVRVTGSPAAGDTFTVGPNTGGVGDNRNALLLGELQTAKTLGNTQNNAGVYQGSSLTFSSGYAYMVSQVGNKTREMEVTSTSAEKLLSAAVEAQQAESGVNLDEEAANLMRYQQAYQAAAKVMATASELFDLLLELGA